MYVFAGAPAGDTVSFEPTRCQLPDVELHARPVRLAGDIRDPLVGFAPGAIAISEKVIRCPCCRERTRRRRRRAGRSRNSSPGKDGGVERAGGHVTPVMTGGTSSVSVLLSRTSSTYQPISRRWVAPEVEADHDGLARVGGQIEHLFCQKLLRYP